MNNNNRSNNNQNDHYQLRFGANWGFIRVYSRLFEQSGSKSHTQVNTLLDVLLVSLVLLLTTMVFPAECDETAENGSYCSNCAFDVLILKLRFM